MSAAVPVSLPKPAEIRRGRLFRRYFLFIMALVCGALLASGGISLYASYQENRAGLARLQKEKAVSAAARIEQFIKGIEQQLSFAALPQLGTDGAEQRRIEFLKLLRQAPAVTDITQLDTSGQEVLAVSRLSMDTAGGSKDRSADPAFTNAKPGKPWFGPVYFRKETEPYFTVGLRTGSGVTVAEVNLKFVWDVVSRIRVGEKGKAYVVDNKGQLVADPDIGLVLRKTDLSALEQVKAALGGKGEDEPALMARAQGGGEVLTAWSAIETLGWEVFVEQPVSEVYDTLNATIVRTGLLLLAGLVVSAIVSTFLARSMVRPIRELQEGAQRIGAGNLDQRIEVKTDDELESLAEQFNQMTVQLRESYSGLERKVEERTGELTESLEYQTAISEVLRVISESPTDVAPVFRTILECTQRLFDDPMTAVFLYDGKTIDMVATSNWTPEALEDSRRFYPGPPNPVMMSGRVITDGRVLTIDDTHDDPGYDQGAATAGQWRRMLGAPMLKDGATVGAIVVAWEKPGETPQRQADLLKTFADQAVIAIENVRLINETKVALERQTATSEVLRVISRSVADAQPVFQIIAERTSQLFGGEAIGLLLVNGDKLELGGAAGRGVQWNLATDTDVIRRFFPKPLTRETSSGVAVLERRVVEIPDVEAPEVIKAMPNLLRLMRAVGYRSELCVPMMRGREAIGTISVNRAQPGSFKPGEIELLQTFADQAVIAIENARLFNETREALEQQTATADVLKAISRTTFELEPVLNALIENATRLCKSDRGFVFIREGDEYRAMANFGTTPEQLEFLQARPLTTGSRTLVGRVARTRNTVQIADARTDPEYDWDESLALLGFRTMLGVPMLREGEPVGVVAIWRDQVRPFAERDMRLVASFADQAVIAIENVRLFREIQEKSHQLELANQHKSEFLANMSHELRTPLNAVIGFSEVLIEGMFGDLNEKQLDYVQDIHSSGKHLLSLINDILDLSKIEAGRMELEVSTFDLPGAIDNAVTLVRERAQRHGIELRTEVLESLGDYSGDERKFKQIMLNLLSNAVKFTGDGGRVTVKAHLGGEGVQISVTDTGIGIAPEDQPKVFEEFVQVGSNYATKREGTGLGLPLARRFVELHGGRMWLESEPGVGSTFFFSLPIRAGVSA